MKPLAYKESGLKRRVVRGVALKSALKTAACSMLAGVSLPLLAADNHMQLQQSIENYLLDLNEVAIVGTASRRVEVDVGYIDPRLNLPDCPAPHDLSLNGSRQAIGKLQIKVFCPGSSPWTKYVSAEVRIYEPVLVATGNLPRGTMIEEHHFSFAEMDIANLRRSPITEPEQAIGMELKYSLTTGSPLAVEGLQAPKVVRRGDMVQLVAETNTLQIRQQGEALQDGEVGKLINVRNNSSELVVQAVVVSAGRVKVQL